MSAVAYRCPGCGAFLPANPETDILTCRHCGVELLVERNEYDKSLRYLRERDLAERKEREAEAKRKHRENVRNTAIFWGLLAVLMILGLLFHEGVL